jgi:hypothetical protein
MSEAADRTAVLRGALEAAITGDEAAVERLYADDVVGWSPSAAVASRQALAVDMRGRAGAFSDVDVAVDAVDACGETMVAWSWTRTSSSTRPAAAWSSAAC